MVDKTPYVQKLKKYYEEKYQVPLSDELALEYFDQLLELIESVYHPIPKTIDKSESLIA